MKLILLETLVLSIRVDEREVERAAGPEWKMVYLDKEKRLFLPHCQNRACTIYCFRYFA